MSDDKSEKPDPIEDVRKGLGLLFRAAKSTLDQIPTQKLEEAVVSGAREVGRAIENVTGVIDKQIFKRTPATGEDVTHGPKVDASPEAPNTEAKSDASVASEAKGDKESDVAAQPSGPEESRGPRVG